MNKTSIFAVCACVLWAHEAMAFLHNHQMHQGAQIGDVQAIRKLLTLADQTGVNWAVECAAGNGQGDTLKALIDNGNVSSLSPDQHGINVSLMRAASYGDLEIVKYLIQHSIAEVPLPDQMGINWAITEGAKAGNLEIVKYLLEHQFSNIPYPDQEGVNNAATHAALEGHLSIFHFLSSHPMEDIPYPDEDIMKELREEHAPENEFVEILLDLLTESERDFPSSFQNI